MVCWPVHSMGHTAMWPMVSRRELLSLWPTWWCTSLCVCAVSHPGTHNYEVLLAAWSMPVWAPLTASRMKPKMGNSQEQTKVPGPLSSHLQAPRDCTLNWSRNSGHWLLSWSCWGDGLWEKCLPLSQTVQHLNKTSLLSHQHLPHKSGFCGNRQPDPCCCCCSVTIWPLGFWWTVVPFPVMRKTLRAACVRGRK